jgi:hypothetical protein
MTMTPQIRGTVQIRSAPAEFLQAFRQRVATGLLSGKPHPRSNYVVTQASLDRLHVHAVDWWTAISVGLNELDLQFLQQGTVRYQVRFWRWASYALGLSGVLGTIGLLLLLTLDARTYIARFPERMLPGLSVDQNLLVAWAMVLFWGFLWPWILIVLHKPSLRRLITRLIAEVDAQGTVAPP